jgi:protein transport protein SEC61 subunit gamma and related proteins
MENETESFVVKWRHKIKTWYNEYKRILMVTKKPSKEEFLAIVKVSGIGILAIGIIGFIIQMINLTLFK